MSQGRRRRADLSALVWGMVFVVVGAAHLLQAFGVWQVRTAVLVPTLLILAGVVVLAHAVTRERAGAQVSP